MTRLRTVLAAYALLALLLAGFVWSGIYDVSAAKKHWRLTAWVLEIARRRSVEVRVGRITPPSLSDPRLLAAGGRLYDGTCRGCHGAPGRFGEDFASAMYPSPPDLGSAEVQALSDAALFWIVQNGLKMTGMPSFGAVHEETSLWSVVAFLRRLKGMSGDQYDAAVRQARTGG